MFGRRILKGYNTNTDEWMNLSVDTIRPSDVPFVSPNTLGFAVACQCSLKNSILATHLKLLMDS